MANQSELKSAEFLKKAAIANAKQPGVKRDWRRLRALSLVGFLLLSSAGAFFFRQQGDLVAAASVVVVGFSALYGTGRGALGLVVSLVALAAAFHLGPQIGLAAEDEVAAQLGTSGVLNRGIAIGLAGLGTFAAFNLFSSLTLWFLMGKSNQGGLNQLLGFVAGAGQGALVVLVAIGGFLVLEPSLPDDLSSPALLQLSDYVQESRVTPWVEKYNLFVHVPQLNQFERVKRVVATLRDPQQLKRLLQHPTMEKLKQRPDTKEAILQVIRDPEIRSLFANRDRFDEAALQTLLQSDVVLNLLDQPGFLTKAQLALAEMDMEEATSSMPVDLSPPSTEL